MVFIVNILLFIVLGIIVFQDMKFRAISWILIPALFIILIAKEFAFAHANDLIFNTLFNFSFVIIQFVLLTIYMSLKNRRLTNIINSYLGIGDLLFFLAITVAFSPLNFLLFFVISMTITLLFFIAYKIIKKNASPELPLAGGMAAVMLVLNVIAIVEPQLNYSNEIVLNVFMMR